VKWRTVGAAREIAVGVPEHVQLGLGEHERDAQVGAGRVAHDLRAGARRDALGAPEDAASL
jgi:hypothetical protein